MNTPNFKIFTGIGNINTNEETEIVIKLTEPIIIIPKYSIHLTQIFEGNKNINNLLSGKLSIDVDENILKFKVYCLSICSFYWTLNLELTE